MFNFKTGLIFILFLHSFYGALSALSARTIAFAQDTLANDFRKAQLFEVRDALAKHSQTKFVYSDAKGQTSLLIHQINHFIATKADLIIVGTNDEKAVVPVVSKAYQSNIPVIILDRGITGKEYTTFIHSDNVKIGTLGARYIAKRLGGRGKVLLFEGLQKADVTKLRTKGFMDEIRKHKQITVLKRTGNYLRKDAIFEMEKLIASGEKIDAIFAESDSMLSGARLAMQRRGIDPSSLVTVGCDYTSEARDAIKAGTQSGSVLFPLGGKKAAETALRILKGEKVPKHIVIPVQLVTKENIEKVDPIF
ncbi:MAG: substrate-binding domain-containing protein [Campylobacterales bacterium]|nr:substrate-binding domain-containing protein [Campylobacterales bacterium]